jgi:photoactive yellow protein
MMRGMTSGTSGTSGTAKIAAETISVEFISSLSRDQYDDLAFGVIELDGNFIVRNYNRPESLLARRSIDDTIGKHFFHEVAPCTDNPDFRGRIEAIMRPDAVDTDVRFDFVFTFPWGRRSVRVRALRGGSDHCWMFVTPVRSLDVNTDPGSG